jgi:hypothetical protein
MHAGKQTICLNHSSAKWHDAIKVYNLVLNIFNIVQFYRSKKKVVPVSN